MVTWFFHTVTLHLFAYTVSTTYFSHKWPSIMYINMLLSWCTYLKIKTGLKMNKYELKLTVKIQGFNPLTLQKLVHLVVRRSWVQLCCCLVFTGCSVNG